VAVRNYSGIVVAWDTQGLRKGLAGFEVDIALARMLEPQMDSQLRSSTDWKIEVGSSSYSIFEKAQMIDY
jgi:hypothetical protein